VQSLEQLSILLESKKKPIYLDVVKKGFSLQSSALQGAIFTRRIEVLKLLLEAGADPNIKTGNQTLLIHAAGNLKQIELLLKHGADIDGVDNHGRTPLMLASASFYDDTKIIHTLLKAGANTRIRDQYGDTAFDIVVGNIEHLDDRAYEWGLDADEERSYERFKEVKRILGGIPHGS